MSATRWAIGVAIAAATVAQLTLLATDVASRNGPPDERGKPGRAPASIQLTPDPIAIQCDGVDASTITVRITDAQGRAVPDGTIVHFDARFGFVEPVEVETRRGEASTQLRMYASARNFPGDTGVDVFTDGLRASVGVDCLPAGPPCNPFSPPTHPASPPCSAGPCSTTDSPPIGTSPPCPTPTPDPSCFPQSPPCTPCGPAFSPPCSPLNEVRLDAYPDTAWVEDYGRFEVGASFRVSVRVALLGETPYVGYQWAIEWPNAGLSFDGNVVEAGPSFGLSNCAESTRAPVIDPAYDDAHVGGCFSNDAEVSFVGELTEFSVSCVGRGLFKLQMIDSRTAPSLETALFDRDGGGLPTTARGIFVECVLPVCGPAVSLPCARQASLAFDVDITNGSGPCTQIDDAASMSMGESRQVAVCLINPDGAISMAGFDYRVAYDDRVVVAPEVQDAGLGLDDNPDANAGTTTFTTPQFPLALGGGWDCQGGVGAYAKGDTDGLPQNGTGTAFSGGCGSAPGPNTLIQGPLGVITFTALSVGSTSLAFFRGAVVTDNLVELGSCDPVIEVAMPCLGATIVVGEGPATPAQTGGRGIVDLSTPTPAPSRAPSRQRP